MKAVLLHELAHLKNKSSIAKYSDTLLRMFSPISLLLRFHHDNTMEEKRADNFVIEIQRTDKHLKSAKRKIDEFEEMMNDGAF